MQVDVISILLYTIRPLFLLNGILLYLLGVGMARYYGANPNWNLVILGQLWLLALQLAGLFLHAYFNIRSRSTPEKEKENRQVLLSRPASLLIAYAFLAAAASLSVLLIRVVATPAVFLLMSAMACGALCYPVPPIRLEYSGYGELVLSLLVANLTPALGYLLQGGDSLRLLAMVTFPLTMLHLAMLLVFSLSSYAGDIKYARRTLMILMGWQNGMLLHNILILGAYLLFLLAITFGLPWQIGVPALLTLPIGILQIWTVNRIAAGAKPQWKLLKVMSGALFGITAYLLAFSFWIR
jgi:1,4-dihydroxy-2-naphthoate octaprenyltransferase